MDTSFGWTVAATVTGAVLAPIALWAQVVSTRWSKRAEAAERQRLKGEVLGQITSSATVTATVGNTSDVTVVPTRAAPDQGSEDNSERTSGRVDVGPGQARQSEENAAADNAAAREAVYDQLLINDYALGLTQARRAFNVSMSFSILGGLVLVIGVALAIFRADTGGQVAGAAITSAAGVLTSGLSQLFRGQSAKALKHLEAQTTELRKDVRAQTNVGKALHILEYVADVELRSHLQAALILEFTGAKLPNFGKLSQTQPGAHNGSLGISKVTELSSPSS